ncbi:MAG: hypothetical protein ACP5RD_00880 [bacterium]
MFDLSKIISHLNLSDLMLKYSQSKKELDNVVVNYHPQNVDNYYQDNLPSKLIIAEFVLNDNIKQNIENELKQNIDKILSYLPSINTKKEIINVNVNISNKFNQDKVNKLLKQIMNSIPQKAFIVKTDHVLMVLTQYDKIKQEMGDLNNINNNLRFKPKTVMYDTLSTVYNIERDIKKVSKYAQEEFVNPFKVDLYGVSNKDFLKNAYYDPMSNKLVLGTFFNLATHEVINASNDTDVVIHELGHKLLDNLRPGYIDNQFHFESGAVHEAFGDINAFLAVASDPNIEKYIKENNIDLTKSNLISQISEYFGKSIYTNIKQVKELLNTNPYMSQEELSKIKDEKPIRDLSLNFEYKKYSELKNEDKEVHLQSKSLSNCFYKAFINFYQDNKNKYSLNEIASKFYDVFIKGAKINNPSTTTIPEFMKSIIVADILFNNSELAPYLIKAANENKIFDNLNVSDILNEINNSKNLSISELSSVLNNKKADSIEFKKILKELILKILKNYSKEFSYLNIDDLKVNLVPGFDGGINIEVSYKYPKNIKVRSKEYPVYGGAIFVFDNKMNLIYSYIENISDQKVKDMQDYANILFKQEDDNSVLA